MMDVNFIDKSFLRKSILPYGILKTHNGWALFNRNYQKIGDYFGDQSGDPLIKDYGCYFNLRYNQIEKIKSLSTGAISDDKIFFYIGRINEEKYFKLIKYICDIEYKQNLFE